MNAVDTNVLLYAHDPRDVRKQSAAIELLESLTEGVLLWQVACEYLAASRKLEQFGYDRRRAWQDIQDLGSVWTRVLPDWTMHGRAQVLMDAHSLSFWDALILAACQQAGVQRLFTEDMSPSMKLDKLELINPFAERH